MLPAFASFEVLFFVSLQKEHSPVQLGSCAPACDLSSRARAGPPLLSSTVRVAPAHAALLMRQARWISRLLPAIAPPLFLSLGHLLFVRAIGGDVAAGQAET